MTDKTDIYARAAKALYAASANRPTLGPVGLELTLTRAGLAIVEAASHAPDAMAEIERLADLWPAIHVYCVALQHNEEAGQTDHEGTMMESHIALCRAKDAINTQLTAIRAALAPKPVAPDAELKAAVEQLKPYLGRWCQHCHKQDKRKYDLDKAGTCYVCGIKHDINPSP